MLRFFRKILLSSFFAKSFQFEVTVAVFKFAQEEYDGTNNYQRQEGLFVAIIVSQYNSDPKCKEPVVNGRPHTFDQGQKQYSHPTLIPPAMQARTPPICFLVFQGIVQTPRNF